jgi:energy-coupling factor transport system ATP-binding protein
MLSFIAVNDLHFSYPNYVTALQGVNLSIGKGELVAIMGENGAGKTTLVKHFNGLLKSQSGSVTVDGIDTRNATVAELSKRVGYVFQNPLYQLFSETVEKELSLGLSGLNLSVEEKKNRIDQALVELGVEKFRNRHPLMLSEGERKRVAIASVLVMDPEAIVLDEPTLALDYIEKRRLSGVLERLHNEGDTIILVTHDVEFAFDLSERIVTMSKGRILADLPKEKVLNGEASLDAAGLIEPQLFQLARRLEALYVHISDFSVEGAFTGVMKRVNRLKDI